MNEESKLHDHCCYVYQFSKVDLYGGVLPLHIVQSCDAASFERLVADGLASRAAATMYNGKLVEGLILTEKGMQVASANCG